MEGLFYYSKRFRTLGLSDGRVVCRSFFGISALSFGVSANHSFYYEIDTPKCEYDLIQNFVRMYKCFALLLGAN